MGEGDWPMRYGIVCGQSGLAGWQADVVRRLRGEEAIPVVGIMVDGAHRTRTFDRSVVWWMYRRGLLERLAATQQRVDAVAALDRLPVVQCSAHAVDDGTLRVDAADVEMVLRYELDFILAFAPHRLSGVVLTAARHGVWSFHYGMADAGNSTAPCFVEVRDRVDIVEVQLNRTASRLEDDAVLYRGWVRTVPHSYRRTVERAHRATIGWVGRACRQLRQTGQAAAEPGRTDLQRAGAHRAHARPVRTPGVGAVASLGVRLAYRKAVRVLRATVRHEHWGVGIVDAPIESFLKPHDLPAATWLPSPSSRHYVADPFGLPDGGSPVLLVEAFDYLRRRGHVAAISTSSAGPVDLQPVFPPDGHMSYPYMFTWRGDVYCTPESCAQRSVTLWRAVDFPHEWKRICTLVDDFPAADPSVVRHEGRWYLFCTDDDLGTDSNLHIYHAEELTGPWHPHVLNPVKTDARSARPAGTPFRVDDRLCRPAQNGSARYGGALVVNEVTALTPTTFDETVIARVGPDPNGPFPKGLHTLAAVGDKTVIDGKRETLVPQSLIGRAMVLLSHARDGGRVTQPVRTAESWTMKRS